MITHFLRIGSLDTDASLKKENTKTTPAAVVHTHELGCVYIKVIVFPHSAHTNIQTASPSQSEEK